MQKSTYAFISFVAAVAVIAAALLFQARPTVTHEELTALLVLSAIAVAGEMLAFVLLKEARGSIAFIPYLAAILIVPSWAAVVSVTVVKLVMESLARIDRRKAVFNAFSHGLTLVVAISVYLGLGGVSFLTSPSTALGVLTSNYGMAAIAAFASSFVVNALLVSVVMALESGESIVSLSIQMSRNTIAADLLATPVVFVFAWVYSAFGAMAAAVCWVPIVGIRHVNRVNLELERTNRELLQLMVKAIEARDPYTSGHSRRVSTYATAIAKILGLSQRDVTRIGTAALLHDVGKIYEKYAPILSKEGRLTPAEWATMQEHPIDGAGLVATISRMRDVVPAVRHHHENWDGTGYPDRIGGLEIPLASRIIMFADTIDAMTSERPYRRAMSEDQVRAEILKCRGKQFDPEIADRLLASGAWHTLFGGVDKRSGWSTLSLVNDRLSGSA